MFPRLLSFGKLIVEACRYAFLWLCYSRMNLYIHLNLRTFFFLLFESFSFDVLVLVIVGFFHHVSFCSLDFFFLILFLQFFPEYRFGWLVSEFAESVALELGEFWTNKIHFWMLPLISSCTPLLSGLSLLYIWVLIRGANQPNRAEPCQAQLGSIKYWSSSSLACLKFWKLGLGLIQLIWV